MTVPIRLARPLAAAARRLSAVAGWCFAAMLTGAVAAWTLDPAGAGADRSLTDAMMFAWLNGLPVALAAALLFALTNRAVTSLALAVAAYAALLTAGAIKLEQLGLPLLPADFRFLSAGGGAALFRHYVEVAQIALPCAFVVVALAALRREPARWRAAPSTRVALAGLAVSGVIGLVGGAAFWRDTYDGWNRGFEPWSPAETVARLGVAPTLLMYHWELAAPHRRPPDRDRALEFIAEHADAFGRVAERDGDGVAPDIIVVQSESFFDPALLAGVSAADTMPNFRRLAALGRSGQMRVPTYAGGTIRTEFEVLAGVPLAAFPGVEYPYFELVDAPMPGLMRNLADEGYTTTVLHPNDAAFWNRRDALARLGAQQFLAAPAFATAPKSGLFVADAALIDRVLAELDDTDTPQFLFAISMEGHGPYDVGPGLDRDELDAIAVPDTLDEHGALTLRHYLYHLANADRALGRLAEVVQRRARPTVLLFYGDHLPGLHSSFAQLGFVDGRGPKTQPVPYLILDNRHAAPRREDTVAWMLPTLLLETARVQPDAYFALVGALRATPAVLQPDGAGTPPEPRFAELARLRVRDEFDLGREVAALAGTGDAEAADPSSVDEAAN